MAATPPDPNFAPYHGFGIARQCLADGLVERPISICPGLVDRKITGLGVVHCLRDDGAQARKNPANSLGFCRTGGASIRLHHSRCAAPPGLALLDHALRQHGVCNLDESGDVGSVDITHLAVLAFAVVDAGLVDAAHDFQQAMVNFFTRPR